MLRNLIPATFATYEEFCRTASFYAVSRISDLTRYADPLHCGEQRLAAAGVTFPVTLFG